MPKTDRRRAYRLGWLGEMAALLFYSLQGYRLRHWRYRNPLGEIDLILQRGRLLVALEVKTRRRITHADLITFRQQERIRAGLKHYLAKNPRFAHNPCRYDVLIFSLNRLPLWWRSAL